jgi:hypothetical protein
MRPSNAVRTVWDAEAIDNLAPRLSANPEDRYHPRQFGVHPGNLSQEREGDVTARLFECTISNAGHAPIVWIGDHLDSGEWADGSLPSQAAGLISPGQSGHYQAESGGDIPILSSLMTGTQGWVAFRTTNLSGTTEFFKITHILPYWSPRSGAGVEAMRYDPTIAPGPTEFDTRDKSPASISVKTLNQYSPHDEVAEVQSLPWLIFWSAGQIVTQPYGDFHWHLQIEVSQTAPATPTTIPFPTTPPPNVVGKAYRFSSPDLWQGVWDSDDMRVTAVILMQPNRLLKVSITERDLAFEASDVPISRVGLLEKAMLVDFVPLLRDQVELLARLPSRMIEVQRRGGDEFEVTERLRPETPFFEEVNRLEQGFQAVPNWKPRQLGGDYLSLPHDAVLEIQQFMADGSVIGYGLRYIRPTIIPIALNSVDFDTTLHRRIVLG